MDPIDKAKELIDGERRAQHGDAVKLHEMIARLWTAFLACDRQTCTISNEQVLMMMALLKIARTQSGVDNRDDYVDALGYVALAGRIVDKRMAEDDYEMSLSIPATGTTD
jgi:hypothetical protein